MLSAQPCNTEHGEHVALQIHAAELLESTIEQGAEWEIDDLDKKVQAHEYPQPPIPAYNAMNSRPNFS